MRNAWKRHKRKRAGALFRTYLNSILQKIRHKAAGCYDREEREVTRIMNGEELLRQHGDMGTFVIRVQHGQHNSWQGRVTWTDKNQTVYFRSALELIKMIDCALGNGWRVDDTRIKEER